MTPLVPALTSEPPWRSRSLRRCSPATPTSRPRRPRSPRPPRRRPRATPPRRTRTTKPRTSPARRPWPRRAPTPPSTWPSTSSRVAPSRPSWSSAICRGPRRQRASSPGCSEVLSRGLAAVHHGDARVGRDHRAGGDLASAAAGAGAIAGACGNCHRALGKGPSLAPSEPPQDDPSGMKRHKWAATQMWHGIVGPSDAAWSTGTEEFSRLPECRPDFGGEIVDPQGDRGRAGPGRRAHRAGRDRHRRRCPRKLYGEYLGGCGTCHAAGC